MNPISPLHTRRPRLRPIAAHRLRRDLATCLALVAFACAFVPLPAIDTEEVQFTEDGIADGAVRISRAEATDELRFTDAVSGSVLLGDLLAAIGDHGALSGLDEDHHTQYLTAARHLIEHVASANDSLAVTPDIAGNTTLGDHLGDSTIHLRRNAPESVSGLWTMLALLHASGGLHLSDGGDPGDVGLTFARTAGTDASFSFLDSADRFALDRPLEVAGDVDLSSTNSARVSLRQHTGVLGEEGRIVFDGDDDGDTYAASEGGDVITIRANGVSIWRMSQYYTRQESGSHQVQAMSGSATTPSYSYNGDTNTGAYHSVGDHLDWSTGGVRAGGFDESGNFDARGAVRSIGGFSVNGVAWTTGSGSPEGVVAAPVGSLYSRVDGAPGSTLYVKQTGGTGNTGWAAK
jgi:hypothetical protein